jgi:hypothetical protein
MLCEKCGSINVARTQSSRLDRIVRFFTGRKRFTCRRCGWTARRDWHQPRVEKTEPTPGSGPVKAEPRDDLKDFEEGRLD